MSNRPHIQTSVDAFKSLNAHAVREMYSKIIEALKVLGLASTEKIAEYLCVAHEKVHKRTSEMEKLEMIWRPGIKTATKSGRSAFQWQIRGDHQPTTDKQQKELLKYTKPIEEYSKSIAEIKKSTQIGLF